MGSHAFSSKPAKNELHIALDALRHIVRALRLSSNHAEKSHDVSGAQLYVLQTLAEASASSIVELASRTVTDPSSVSVVVKRLTEDGFVARRQSKRDARRVELVLTRKGEAVARAAPRVAQTSLIDAFASLAPSTRRSLSRGLAELVQKMGGASETPALFFEEGGAAEAGSKKSSRISGTRHRALS
ncbi:MAG: MarR family transcriptional regulator [Polyangiaceae bacterium]